MDFGHVFSVLFKEFDRQSIRYALMGGVALGALGVPRATMDVDILIHRDDLVRLHDIMIGRGYERRYADDNVSHYAHCEPRWGRVDFIHALRAHSLAALGRVILQPVMNGSRMVPVLTPEDVIGFKIQSIANDSTREAQDYADIEALVRHHRASLDWSRVEEYYDLFGRDAEFRVLEERFRHAQ